MLLVGYPIFFRKRSAPMQKSSTQNIRLFFPRDEGALATSMPALVTTTSRI